MHEFDSYIFLKTKYRPISARMVIGITSEVAKVNSQRVKPAPSLPAPKSINLELSASPLEYAILLPPSLEGRKLHIKHLHIKLVIKQYQDPPPNHKMSAIPPATPNAETLCDLIPKLAHLFVAELLESGAQIGAATEIEQATIQGTETAAYEALLDVFCIGYQRVVDGLDPPLPTIPGVIDVQFGFMHKRAGELGRYQASRDMEDGIAMDENESMSSVSNQTYKVAKGKARDAVRNYHNVCAFNLLWNMQSKGKVVRVADIEKAKVVDGGVRVIMKDSTEMLVNEENAGKVQYAGLLAIAEA